MTTAIIRRNSIVELAEQAGISLAEASRRLTLEAFEMPPRLQNRIALPLMCGTAFAVAFAAARLI